MVSCLEDSYGHALDAPMKGISSSEPCIGQIAVSLGMVPGWVVR